MPRVEMIRRSTEGTLRSVLLQRDGTTGIRGHIEITELVTQGGQTFSQSRTIGVDALPVGDRAGLEAAINALEAAIKERDYSGGT